ncbi:esterase/lipase family protein [Rheinheimera sp.]|uniref:esterase/lipase family protein n=1 Tax=Rheinheimera sp. TaxID=1869214 RepID=UPI003AF9B12C
MLRLVLLLLLSSWLGACSSPHFLRLLPSTQQALEANQLFAYQYAAMQQLSPQELSSHCMELALLPEKSANRALRQLSCAALWLPVTHNADEKSQAVSLYNQSLNQLLLQLHPRKKLSRPALRLELLPVVDETGASMTDWWPTSLFSSDRSEYQPPTNGLGVSIVAARERSDRPEDLNYPPEGVYRSYTVLLDRMEFGEEQQIKLFFRAYDEHQLKQQPELGLRFDAAASYLWLMQHAKVMDFELSGLFSAADSDERYGVFSVTPLSAHKIPILMIHGLNSSPVIWFELSLAILQNPALAERYQIWHAFYPSGPPPFYNAMRMRKKTDELLARLQQQQCSPELQQMVIVGHSMGGIISKTFILNSGYELWDRTFIKRPEQLGASAEQLNQISDIFLFSARPYVDKVIFLDTPHGGSEMSGSLLGRLTSAFITLPGNFLNMFRQLLDKIGIHQLTPQMQPYFASGGPNSVQALSPSHPLLQGLNQLPYQRPVYSIVGSDGALYCFDTKSCSQLSDGVVPYLSAHQPKAEQQLIVQSSHNSYRSPEALNFILKLLSSPSLTN